MEEGIQAPYTIPMAQAHNGNRNDGSRMNVEEKIQRDEGEEAPSAVAWFVTRYDPIDPQAMLLFTRGVPSSLSDLGVPQENIADFEIMAIQQCEEYGSGPHDTFFQVKLRHDKKWCQVSVQGACENGDHWIDLLDRSVVPALRARSDTDEDDIKLQTMINNAKVLVNNVCRSSLSDY